jgi:ABC-2 type transport system permease protein
MNGSVFYRLVLKDLYLVRWMIAGALVAGVGAVALMPVNRVATYVGGVSLVCVLIVLNIFLVMTTVAQERKDKVLLFVLSLPISTRQYLVAKMTANLIAFVVPWLVLSLLTIAVIDRTPLPNGVLPFWVTLLGYLLAYNCVLLAIAVATDSTGWQATVITAGNISVNFFIPFMLSRPSIAAHAEAAAAVWTPDIFVVLAIEIAIAIVALPAAVAYRSRDPDLV